MGIFDKLRGDSIRVQVVIHGQVSGVAHAIDDHLRLPVGTTLARLAEVARFDTITLAELVAHNPTLADTLLLNGEACAVATHGERVLQDGDELRLLAP